MGTAARPAIYEMNTLCIVNPDYIRKIIGGAEVQTFLIGRALAELGWRVLFVSEAITETRVDAGIELVPFTPSASARKSIVDLAELMRGYGVDICYQRGRKKYSCYAHGASTELGIPYVNAFSMDLDFQRFKFLFRDATSPRKIAIKLLRLRKLLEIDLCSLAAIRNAACILVQSEYQKTMARKKWGIQARIIRNAHPLPDESELEKPGGRPIVLWLATIKEWKRPEVFLDLARDMLDDDVDLIMAGNLRSERYRERIEALQRDQPNFSYVPCNSLDESNRLIGRASVFVNTSKLEEGFPNTFVQAWLRETAVVSLEFDPDGLLRENGLGRCSQSYDKLLEDVRELAGKGPSRNAVAATARAYATETHSIEKIAPEISDIFVELIQARKASIA